MGLHTLSDSELMTLRTQCLVMAQSTCGSPAPEDIITAAKAFEAYVLGTASTGDGGTVLKIVA